MRISKVLLLQLCVLSGLLAGCDARVREYVSEAHRPKEPAVIQPIVPAINSTVLKVSPGKMLAVSSDGQARMDATITPTGRKLTGGDVSAVMSLNQSRVQTQ